MEGAKKRGREREWGWRDTRMEPLQRAEGEGEVEGRRESFEERRLTRACWGVNLTWENLMNN